MRDTYGMAEMVAAASECDHGRLHLWPEAGVVEVLDDDGVVAAIAGFLATSMGFPGPEVEGVGTWLDGESRPGALHHERDVGAAAQAVSL